MSWQDPRGAGAVATVVRRSAHSDDAKHRTDETTQVRPPRVPRWVPIVAGVLILLVGAGAAVGVMASSGDHAGPKATSGPPPSGKGPSGFDAKTGLPIAPTTTDVTYLASSKCIHPSEFASCSGLATETLVCPGGKCTIGMAFGPLLSAGRLSTWQADKVVLTFDAGQPSFSKRGSVGPPSSCGKRPVTMSGQRRADGSYALQFAIVHPGGSNGACLSSPATYTGSLTAAAK